MARQNAADQLQRRQRRNAAEERRYNQEGVRKRQIRSWIILVAVALAVVLGIHFLRGYGKSKEISLVRLPCYSNQSVTPFRDGMVYYDGATIHHLSSGGTIRWSFPAGNDVHFTAGPTHLAIWSGRQLFLVDRSGNATYNESLLLRNAGRVHVDAGAGRFRHGAEHGHEHLPGGQDEHGGRFPGRSHDLQGDL